jgi:hypothetical protein
MGRVAVRSRSAGAVFLAGVVAASLKLLDLFVPGTDVLALSRPIQAILLEALAGAIWANLVIAHERGTVPVRGQSLDGPAESRKRPHLLTTGRP